MDCFVVICSALGFRHLCRQAEEVPFAALQLLDPECQVGCFCFPLSQESGLFIIVYMSIEPLAQLRSDRLPAQILTFEFYAGGLSANARFGESIQRNVTFRLSDTHTHTHSHSHITHQVLMFHQGRTRLSRSSSARAMVVVLLLWGFGPAFQAYLGCLADLAQGALRWESWRPGPQCFQCFALQALLSLDF